MSRDDTWQDPEERADREAYLERIRTLAAACRTEREHLNATRRGKDREHDVSEWSTQNILDALRGARPHAETGEPLEDYLLLLSRDRGTLYPRRLATPRGLYRARVLWHREQHAAGACELHDTSDHAAPGGPPGVRGGVHDLVQETA